MASFILYILISYAPIDIFLEEMRSPYSCKSSSWASAKKLLYSFRENLRTCSVRNRYQ